MLCGICVWAFVNGTALRQVVHFGRSRKLPLFHGISGALRMQE